jgi:UDP-4-amino-4,6-dideoxy-N-acetyl-beta-L-altrosamine transaminase
MINYGRQSIDLRDLKAVRSVLRSNLLTQGPSVPAFEKAIAEKVKARHGVAFNSATSALHAACLSRGVGKGDLVWTAAMSFVASANCAIYCGAEVDFVDIEPNTGNISVKSLEDKLLAAETSGRLPKVLIPVHFAGQPYDMQEVATLARRYGFKVIEDASHALGAFYLGKPIGEGAYSDVTVFSFHPVKMITTGEGGMCMTNSQDVAEKLNRIRSHGITRDPDQSHASVDGPWSYDQIELGYNYRLTDFQAALGVSQLSRLDKFVSRRIELAGMYDKLLANSSWRPLESKSGRESSHHLYVVQNARGMDARQEAYASLMEIGVAPNVHYRPIYRNTYYASMGKYNPQDYPGAEQYYSSAISIPLFFGLKKRDVIRIGKLLRKL